MKRITSVIIAVILSVGICASQPQTSHAATNNLPKQQFANVVVFAYLSSDPETEASDKAFFEDEENVKKIMKEYEGSHGRSMKNYLKTISYDQFELINVFPQYDKTENTITPYKLSVSKQDAKTSNVDSQVITEILNNNPNLSDYAVDYNMDGYIDNFTVILRDETSNTAGGSTAISTTYPHKSDYSGNTQLESKTGNVKVGAYNILNTLNFVESISSSGSGLSSHEFLHTLGYSDLYNDEGTHPVRNWSIMGLNGPYLQWPLAYERMYFSNWISIDSITESGTYTLDNQLKADGNQAYIIKSPLKSQEEFVVEFRKLNRTSVNDEDTLDSKIGYYFDSNETGGIIVYRINKGIEYLSNRNGEDGIYVFRPQNLTGLTGTESDKNAAASYRAALSVENGRTSIGSSDWNAGLKDGALTFCDGSNSGIVITTNSSGKGDQMDFTVTMPDTSGLDSWVDMNFSDSPASYINKNSSITSYNGKVYLQTYKTDGKIETFCYENDSWKQEGGIDVSNPYQMKSWEMNGKLYLAVVTLKGDFNIYNYSNGSWELKDHMDNVQECDFDVDGKKLWIFLQDFNSALKLASFEGSTISMTDKAVVSDPLCGGPRISVVGGIPYMGYRDARNENAIVIKKFENESIKDVQCSLTGENYDIASLNGCLYVSTVKDDKLVMSKLSNGKWTTGGASDFATVSTNLTVSSGNIYFLYSSNSGEGNTIVYQYDADKDEFIQEGTAVDAYSERASLASIDGDLYISYVSNGQTLVKCKKPANPKDEEKPEPEPEPSVHVHEPVSFTIAAGYCKNGSSGTKCATCKKILKSKVIPGYSTYYVKSWRVSKGRKSFAVKWKRQSKANQKKFTGYQIRYSRYSNMSCSKYAYAKKSSSSRKISKLSAKKKYYVRVRTYRTVNGKRYYSKWSSTKVVKTR